MLRQAIQKTRTPFLILGVPLFLMMSGVAFSVVYEELLCKKVLLHTKSGRILDVTHDHFFYDENGLKRPIHELANSQYDNQLEQKISPNYQGVVGLGFYGIVFLWVGFHSAVTLKRRLKKVSISKNKDKHHENTQQNSTTEGL